MQHSIAPPSGAGVWVHCQASIMAQEGITGKEHPNRKEGEALHDIGFCRLTTPDHPINTDDVTRDGLERIKQYVTYINSIRGDDPHFEERIECKRIHPKCFGTPDYWEYFPADNLLIIGDYKDGFLNVEAFENWQLTCYTTGILDKLQLSAHVKVRFVIVQPRSYGSAVKTWNTTALELRGAINKLSNAAHEALEDRLNAAIPVRAGLHCRYCLRQFDCEESTKQVNSIAHSAVFNHGYQENDIKTELDFLKYAEKMIKFRLAAVEAKAFSAIHSGQLQGYTIDTGYGKTIWSEDVEGRRSLSELMGIEITRETFITPTQAIKAGLPKEMVRSLTTHKAGKSFLKPVDLKKAQEIFGV